MLSRSTLRRCHSLGSLATEVLVAEATLTPKPALVDSRGPGAHTDLSLEIMRRSTLAIEPFFEEIAALSVYRRPSQPLRLRLGETGRLAEQAMLQATRGSNAHRGAIWAIGILTASASMHSAGMTSIQSIVSMAARLARIPDPVAPVHLSHGNLMRERYGAAGARGEAQSGFPHVVFLGLPMLRHRRRQGLAEKHARLDALLIIMSYLDDTCLLQRGRAAALHAAKKGARAVLSAGGTATRVGMQRLLELDGELLRRNASPGGSADLLAATLFLDALESGRHER
jgi:triphosphoribosyl-dephospho-CoA synthase